MKNFKIMTKDLSGKAIDIKGKKYVLVSDRIIYFNEQYPQGSITTELVSLPQDDLVIIKATIRPVEGENRAFTGYSQATWGDGYINKTSALENAETSAVGRALAFMGIGVIDSVASVDEIKKTTYGGKQIMTPEEALSNAKKAIEESTTIDDLTLVSKNIKKSKNLTDTDKETLIFTLNEKVGSMDPLKD